MRARVAMISWWTPTWLASTLLAMALLGPAIAPSAHAQSPGEELRQHLEAGRAASAVAAFKPATGRDAEAHMALGFAEFTQAVERLVQGLYRYGLKTPQNPYLPIVRLPVPENMRPEPVDYAKLRALYDRFLADLSTARATLTSVPAGEPKLLLDLHAIQLTVTQSGGQPVLLALRDVVAILGGRSAAGREAWEVAFDRADALWLAGYSHLLSAMIEFIQAHDWQKTYDATAHLFFYGAPLPAGLAAPRAGGMLGPAVEMGGIADQIALLHLIQWPAGDKQRLAAVRAHLKATFALSRETWKAILAETDDDREWLPAPRQQSRAVPSLPITEEALAGWQGVLDEFDALLDGRKLLGHWRFTRGIDLRMVFEDPRPFDLVLWATGHGAVPFLKDGPLTDGRTMQQWNMLFRGNFLGYAFFIN